MKNLTMVLAAIIVALGALSGPAAAGDEVMSTAVFYVH